MISTSVLLRIRQLSGVLVSASILAASTAVVFIGFALIDAAWLRPYQFGSSSELVSPALSSSRTPCPAYDLPPQLITAWEDVLTPAAVGTYRRERVRVEGGGQSSDRWGASISDDLFSVLRVNLAVGRPFTSAEASGGAPVAIISHDMWEGVFGGRTSVLEESIRVNGGTRQVVGVTPPHFALPGVPAASILLPLSVGRFGPITRETQTVRAVIRTSDPEEAERLALGAIEHRIPELRRVDSSLGRVGMSLTPIQRMGQQDSASIPALLGLIGCVLILGVVNTLFLESTRCLIWLPQAAVHRALGATDGRLHRLLAVRLAVLQAAGVSIGLVITYAVLARLGADLQRSLGLVRPPVISPGVLWVASLVGVGSLGISFAILSRFTSRRLVESARILRAGLHQGRLGRRSRQMILGTQLACAAAILTLAASAATLFVSLIRTDLGIATDGVLSLYYLGPENGTPQQNATVLAELAGFLSSRESGVQAFAVVDLVPFTSAPNRAPVQTAAQDAQRTKIRYIDHRYLDLLKVRVLEGRPFVEADLVSPPGVAIVNEVFARQRLNEAALGSSVTIDGKRVLTVVGVVEDTRDEEVNKPAEATVYIPLSDPLYRKALRGILLTMQSPDEKATRDLTAALRQRVSGRGAISRPELLRDLMGDAFVTPATYVAGTAICAVVAILIAVVGTYSVTKHLATSRRREIALRLAIGAPRASIVRMFCLDAFKPLAIGSIVGLLGGMGLAKAVVATDFSAFQLSSVVVITASTLLLCASVLAVALPTWRIAALDPAGVLKGE